MGSQGVSYQAEFDAINEAGLVVRDTQAEWFKLSCPGGSHPVYLALRAARRVLQAAEWRFYETLKASNPIEPFEAEFVPTAAGTWPAPDSLEFVSL